MMNFTDPQELKIYAAQLKKNGVALGFVPTMGDLHLGHASLIRRAKEENEKVCVSLFVNPIQFNDSKDYELYPKNLSRDLELCSSLGVDIVFEPRAQDLYTSLDTFRVEETLFSAGLCGKSRPGHFSGMLTVVLKLLNIVQPTRAYFGEKDYQQLQLVRAMVSAFFLEVEIVACPTVREANGLALSSRNKRISTEHQERATQLFQILTSAKSVSDCVAELKLAGFDVDYVEEKWGRRLAAVVLDKVRLIDNVPLEGGFREEKEELFYGTHA